MYSPTKSGMKNGICGQNEVEISVCTVTHLPSPSSRRKTMKLPLGAAGDHKNTLVTINSEEELFYINPATSRSDKKYTKDQASYKPKGLPNILLLGNVSKLAIGQKLCFS